MPKQARNQSDIEIVREEILDEGLTIILSGNYITTALSFPRKQESHLCQWILDPGFRGDDSFYSFCKKLLRKYFHQLPLKFFLRLGTDNVFYGIAFLEKNETRDGPDTIAGGCNRIFIYIYLHNFKPANIFYSEIIKYGRDHLARPTPWSPEINKYRPGVFDDFIAKVCIARYGRMYWSGCCLYRTMALTAEGLFINADPGYPIFCTAVGADYNETIVIPAMK